MSQLSIAVVGSGIAGIASAWLLGSRHRVTLIERDDRFGGHANTVTVAGPDGERAVDTGFIVYNTVSYPNLVAFFAALGVPTAASNMSFAVSLDGGRYEYSGTGLGGLFGQWSNLVSPTHWRMVADLLRFFPDARRLAELGMDADVSLGDWLRASGYSTAFIERHILPMGAAIWSTPSREMLGFPALAFVRFFSNHGLLQVRDRPQWRTVVGGSREYVTRAVAASGATLIRSNPARRIVRRPDGVDIELADATTTRFDHVVIATHADEALALLSDADADERATLGAFRYAANRAVLHDDPDLMPARRRLWSSWNFLGTDGDRLAVSYWMNRLQPLATHRDLFVTLNPPRPPRADRIIATFDYRHPMFDRPAMTAQRHLWTLQGRRRTWDEIGRASCRERV